MSETNPGEMSGDITGVTGTKHSDGGALRAAEGVLRLAGGGSTREAGREGAIREVGKTSTRSAAERDVGKILKKLEKLSEVVGKLDRTEGAGRKGGRREKVEGKSNRDGEKKLPARLAEVCSAQTLRETPGRALGGEKLSPAKEGWLRGSDKNAAPIPKQIADKLRGREFSSFNWKDGKPNSDSLAANIWKEIAADPVLSKEFAHNPRNIGRMKNGFAPLLPTKGSREFAVDAKGVAREVNPNVKGTRSAPRSGKNNRGETYQIHHVKPIHRGGEVYDFDNLQILNPQHHKSALDPRYHLGK